MVRAPLQLVRVPARCCPSFNLPRGHACSALRWRPCGRLKTVFFTPFLCISALSTASSQWQYGRHFMVCVAYWPYRGRHPKYIYSSSFTRVVVIDTGLSTPNQTIDGFRLWFCMSTVSILDCKRYVWLQTSFPHCAAANGEKDAYTNVHYSALSIQC